MRPVDALSSAPLPRSHTSGAFLNHDMSPCDPYARSQSMYDPSSGPGVRDFRRRGYTSHQMTEEHTKTVNDYVSPPRKAPVANPVTSIANPGRAETSLEFFQGKHTTVAQRSNTITGINDRFTPADIAKQEKERTMAHQVEIQRYIEDVKKQKQGAAALTQDQKRRDLEELKSYDPWGKGSGAPKAHNAFVSKDRLDAKVAAASTDDYAARSFGKQGAGAPVRAETGEVQAHYHVDGDVQVNNVYRSNFGVDAGTRYGPKDQARIRENLEEQTRERSQAVVEEKRREAEEDVARAKLDPMNKMGKGVPPPRVSHRTDPEKEKKQHYAKSLQQQAQAKAASKEEPAAASSDYSPWGRGVGTVERDASGKIVKKAPTQPAPTSNDALVDMLGRPGAGAPVKEGTGKLSPRKGEQAAGEGGSDGYDPFGRPGAGAPGGDARRHRPELLEGTTSPTGNGPARQKFLKEQQELMVQKQKEVEAARVAERQATVSPDQFFKFGQGAANPKRDEEGNLVNQRRGQTDIIGMNLDQGGGLGRKQKTEHSNVLHQQLDKQAQEKRAIEQQQRQQDIASDMQHVQAAGSWQGKAGAGAPRRNENGEIHGRFGLDKEMHQDEFIDTPKVIAKQERAKYAEELAKGQRLKTQMEEERHMTREKSSVHHETMINTFGRPGAGAPLRAADGKVVAQPSRALDPADTKEYRMGGKAGRTID